MKRLTTDQWMGIGLGIMAAGVLALAVMDMGSGSGRNLIPIGAPMPAIMGVLADGQDVRFAEGDSGGEVVLLDFWATWCPSCVRSMPSLEKLQAEFQGRGVRLLTVNLDEARTREDQGRLVRDFLARQRLQLPVLLDDGRNQRAYGAYTLPTLYLVGRDGRIRQGWEGAPSERTLRREIEAALAPGAEG